MKQVFVVALLVAVAAAANGPSYEAMFREFKKTHVKSYMNAAEEARRYKIFVENMKSAEVLQAVNPLATFGAGPFADLSAVDLRRLTSPYKHHHTHHTANKGADAMTPTVEEVRAATGQVVDWRAQGAVTPVQNQGLCGSPWAFTVAGNIEGQWAVAGNPLTPLSAQALVSCDTNDYGCQGGLFDTAFSWLLNTQQGRMVTEASYPYRSQNGTAPACSTRLPFKPTGAVIVGFYNLPTSEPAMAAFVYAKGPLAVGVDATSWASYTGGIMTDCVSQQVGHAAVIVGFNDNNVPPYWIIKNSWGAAWGEQGYIRLAKGSNQCLISTFPSTAIVGGTTIITTPAP